MTLAEEYADQFASDIWEMREQFTFNLHTVESAIEIANQTDGKPIVLADGADNPAVAVPVTGTNDSTEVHRSRRSRCRHRGHRGSPNRLLKQSRQVSGTVSN